MCLNIYKNKKVIIVAILVVIVYFLVGGIEKAAAAQGIDVSIFDPVTWAQGVIAVILSLLIFVANALLTLVSQLLSGILALTEFKDIPLVQNGWRLIRDFINLIFILMLLFIGFATILDLEQYNFKKLLPALLIAALLINFSLPIAGFVLDISQSLTKVLINKMNLTNFDFATTLKNKIGLPKFQAGLLAEKEPAKAVLEALGNFLSIGLGPLGIIIRYFLSSASRDRVERNMMILFLMLFQLLIILVFLFALTAATIFFIVRIVVIWFLLITSPAAYAAYAIPWVKKYWFQWWSKFFSWAFFAPFYIFILYLTLETVSAANLSEQLAQLNAGTFMEKIGLSFKFLLQFILVVILLFGGLKFALSTATKTGDFAMKTAMKVGGAVSGYGFAKGLYGAYKGLYGAYKKKREEFKAPKLTEKLGERLALRMGAPLTERIKARFLPKEERASWLKEQEDKKIAEYQKRNQIFSSKELNDKLEKSRFLSKAEAKAILKIQLERGRVSDEMAPYLNLLTNPEDIKKTLAIRPEILNAFDLGKVEESLGVQLADKKSFNEQLETILKKVGIDKLSDTSLKNARILKAAAAIPEIGVSGIKNALQKRDIATREEMQKHYTLLVDDLNNGQFKPDADTEKAIRHLYALGGGEVTKAFNNNRALVADFIKNLRPQDVDKLDISFATDPVAFDPLINNLTPLLFSAIIKSNKQLADNLRQNIENMTKTEFLNRSNNKNLTEYIDKQGSKFGFLFKTPPPPSSTKTKEEIWKEALEELRKEEEKKKRKSEEFWKEVQKELIKEEEKNKRKREEGREDFEGLGLA